MQRYWHYTVYRSLRGILEDGEIKVTELHFEYCGMPGAWLSTNSIWEETVRKAFKDSVTGKVSKALSRDDLFKRGEPPVRVEIDPKLVSIRKWKNHKKKSGISKKLAKGLEDVGKKWGANPDEWYVSYQPIPVTSWLYPIEIWSGKEWVNIEDAFEAKE